MTVRVLYFAALRDIAGAAEESVSAPDRVRTVGELFQHLANAYPALGSAVRGLRFACNEHFVEPDHLLAEGDTVALIPPVSGG